MMAFESVGSASGRAFLRDLKPVFIDLKSALIYSTRHGTDIRAEIEGDEDAVLTRAAFAQT
jgi:hypothetical protein